MKILAVGAHLDDVEIACGETLAKAKKAGHQVKVLMMSRSGFRGYEIGKRYAEAFEILRLEFEIDEKFRI